MLQFKNNKTLSIKKRNFLMISAEVKKKLYNGSHEEKIIVAHPESIRKKYRMFCISYFGT